MQIIYIYEKSTLNLITKIPANSIEDFQKRPIDHFPLFSDELHIISETKFENPILEKNRIREMTKDELYKVGKYTLTANEIVENGKVKAVELSEFEYIEDNTVKLRRDGKIGSIKKELSELKVEYSEREFLFKGKYLQKNREKGDRDNLTSLILLLTITGRKETSEWKLIDKDTREHVYPTLTLDDFKLMAFHMQSQLSKALKTESEIIARLKTLSDEELKLFNAREEFEKLWES